MYLELEVIHFAASLDFNMVYYHIVLADNDRNICPIILSWGKYKYTIIPMGFSNSPYIFQEE